MKKSYSPTIIKKEEQEKELKLEETDSFFDKKIYYATEGLPFGLSKKEFMRYLLANV